MLRVIHSLVILAMMSALAHGQETVLDRDTQKKVWTRFKVDFIQRDGRVVDKGQDTISHSEGQGYGMLISLSSDDRQTFDLLWNWTKDNLMARKDNLFCWAWGKRFDGSWGVLDYNNATDGDILIAYALTKAAVKWSQPSYKADAMKTVSGIRERLAVRWNKRVVLLPGYQGFTEGDSIVVNPSYLILPAYRAFAEIDDKTFWNTLYADALYLLKKSAFGRLKLPADWVALTGDDVAIYTKRPARFGYEAVRIFLYGARDENQIHAEGIDAMLKFYQRSGYIPSHIDLKDESVSLDAGPAGFYAIYGRLAGKLGHAETSRRLLKEAAEKIATEKDNYYSMSLFLLSPEDF